MINRQRARGPRAVPHRAFTLGLLAFAACTEPRRGIIARSDLLSLDLTGQRGSRMLRLDAAPGARINARLPPVLELRDGTLITFSGDELTADSSYFVASPRAGLGGTRAGTGTLRASVCPADVRVCLSVALDVELPR
jgi:hypothetical protein